MRRRRRREVERPNQEKKKSHKIEEEEDHQVVSLSILLPHTHTEQPRYIGKESLLTLAPIFFYYTVKQRKKRGDGDSN